MARENSRSDAQETVERYLYGLVQDWLGVELKANPHIAVGDTYMCPDFFSREHSIVGEIFGHIGKNKKAQDNKIANDILRMLLLEKKHGKQYRKIIVVVDYEEEQELTGKSLLSESIREFGVEIRRFDIPDELRELVKAAQKKQSLI